MERTNKPTIRIPDAINCTPSNNFTQISNSVLRNPELSAKAKGILCLLLSNQDGWKSHVESICSMMADGETSIRSGLKELEQMGYLKRLTYRDKEKKARRGTLWCYTDVPGEFNLEREEIVGLLNRYGLEITPNYNESSISGKPKSGKPKFGKPSTNNTIVNNTKDNIILSEKIPEEKDSLNSSNKNNEYIPFAEKLAAIIQTNKNIKVPPARLNNWASEIRKLSQVEGVAPVRIEKALDWYAKNIGGEYIPVIESGVSLRNKFIKLEEAMKRAGELPKNNLKDSAHSPGPKQIIKKSLGELATSFEKECYLPAKDLIPNLDGKTEKRKLAQALVSLYYQIQETQDKCIPQNSQRLFPSAMSLIHSYIEWIEDNSWIKDRSMNLFDANHFLFNKFRRDEAGKDNMERDPLTGKSYLKG